MSRSSTQPRYSPVWSWEVFAMITFFDRLVERPWRNSLLLLGFPVTIELLLVFDILQGTLMFISHLCIEVGVVLFIYACLRRASPTIGRLSKSPVKLYNRVVDTKVIVILFFSLGFSIVSFFNRNNLFAVSEENVAKDLSAVLLVLPVLLTLTAFLFVRWIYQKLTA